MDLDECSKSRDRLKISRCSLQGDMPVTRTKNELSLPPILILHFSGLKFFSAN
jgi:hypothetical protein